MITLLVMTNGRKECLLKTMQSANEMLIGPIRRVLVNDDSADKDYYQWLNRNFCFTNGDIGKSIVNPCMTRIQSVTECQGFGGAIINAWETIKTRCYTDTQFVFHLEDDFIFTRPVDLWEMMATLDSNPFLSQVALQRQPWNEAEKAAGSIYNSRPGAFQQKRPMVIDQPWRSSNLTGWIEHTEFFTTNPSLYRRSMLFGYPWPTGTGSEGNYSAHLRECGFKFGYWGNLTDDPWVIHIGNERVGKNY